MIDFLKPETDMVERAGIKIGGLLFVSVVVGGPMKACSSEFNEARAQDLVEPSVAVERSPASHSVEIPTVLPPMPSQQY